MMKYVDERWPLIRGIQFFSFISHDGHNFAVSHYGLEPIVIHENHKFLFFYVRYSPFVKGAWFLLETFIYSLDSLVEVKIKRHVFMMLPIRDCPIRFL